MPEHFDIAITGGGPAGSTFARLIDSRRFKVAIIDLPPGVKSGDNLSGGESHLSVSNEDLSGCAHHGTPEGGPPKFGKPCGGLLSSDAQKALSRFEITLPKEILVSPQIFAVKTIDLNSRQTRYYQRAYINLDRFKFDQWLREMIPPQVKKYKARCASITRKNGFFSLTLRTPEGQEEMVTANYVVGADGATSVVRSALFHKKPSRRYVAIQQWFEEANPNPFYSCVFDRETSDCCSWSISKDHYFIFGGAFAPKGCKAQFEAQKKKLEAYGFRFGKLVKTEACLVLRPKSPFDFCCGGQNAFLIGEAAGFISPSSLEGISWAINSAAKLAELINSGKPKLNAAYRRATFSLRARLSLKLLKCPFMYQPFLRRAVLKSGLQSIDIWHNPPEA